MRKSEGQEPFWKKHEILLKIDVKMRGLEEWKQAFRFILPLKYEVWANLNFHGFWSPKSHDKSIKSRYLVARGWDFCDFGWILWRAEF